MCCDRCLCMCLKLGIYFYFCSELSSIVVSRWSFFLGICFLRLLRWRWCFLRLRGRHVHDLLCGRTCLVGWIGSLILISSSWAVSILMARRVYYRSKLDSRILTSRGRRLRPGWGALRLRASQSISLKKACALISPMPPGPIPSRLAGSIYRRRSSMSRASP